VHRRPRAGCRPRGPSCSSAQPDELDDRRAGLIACVAHGTCSCTACAGRAAVVTPGPQSPSGGTAASKRVTTTTGTPSMTWDARRLTSLGVAARQWRPRSVGFVRAIGLLWAAVDGCAIAGAFGGCRREGVAHVQDQAELDEAEAPAGPRSSSPRRSRRRLILGQLAP
jgi:hypothetical protein